MLPNWAIYGFLAAMTVSLSDLIRKFFSQTKNTTTIACMSLTISGFLSALYLISQRESLPEFTSKDMCLVTLLAFSIIMTHILISKSLKLSPNPGYGKVIVSLNLILTTLVSIYLYQSSKPTICSGSGILLMIIGSILVIVNKQI
jgi:uncharacterized membrane protein